MNAHEIDNQPTGEAAQSLAKTSPTQWISLFRQQVLAGNCPMPFTEGVTPAQQERHTEKLRQRAQDVR